MSRYYLADGMVQRGPFEVTDLPGQGLRPGTLVWKEGMSQWRPADEVEELIFAGVLAPAVPPAPSAAPPPPPPPGLGSLPYANPVPLGIAYDPASSSTNRIAAGVCAIALGTFGVHKFILGMPAPGVIMLLASVVGGFLTCGMAAVAIQVIGIIEGIIYLTRSDEQFYADYVVRRKAWF